MDEVGSHNSSPKTGQRAKGHRQIHRAGTEVEVGTFRGPFPAQLRDRSAAPHSIDIEAEHMIQQVITRSDGREHASDARTFPVSLRRR